MQRRAKIMNEIKRRFKELFSKNCYTRIDATHILDLYIGLDENAQCTLKYRGHFNKKLIKGSAAISIRQGQEKDYCYLLISLNNTDMLDTFCALCSDIVESTRHCENNESGYNTIIDRLYSWKKLFSSKKSKLQESTIMGLIGEMLFLRDYLFDVYGQHESLISWSGQELTHKDFSMDNIWYEVKAIHTGRMSVTINSLEQLQSNNNGELVIISLEKMSEAYNGICVSKIATSILNNLKFDEDKDIFLNQLSTQGYQFDSEDDNFVYECTNISRYKVDGTFPKLIRNAINDAIIKAQYDIDINQIRNFLIIE